MIESDKYGKDGPFEDPVVRCCSCKRLMRMAVLRKRGTCACGDVRVEAVLSVTEEEAEWMRTVMSTDEEILKLLKVDELPEEEMKVYREEVFRVDPAFIALFQPDGLPDA